jgi:hypothetical protein
MLWDEGHWSQNLATVSSSTRCGVVVVDGGIDQSPQPSVASAPDEYPDCEGADY